MRLLRAEAVIAPAPLLPESFCLVTRVKKETFTPAISGP